MEEIFKGFYETGVWAGGKDYIDNGLHQAENIQRFLTGKEITSIVDVGCGHWTWQSVVEWKDIEYIGIDCVSSVIRYNIDKCAGLDPRPAFIQADVMTLNELPKADVLLVKDVFMNWDNLTILRFLKDVREFKWMVFVNDLTPKPNYPIEDGGKTRGISLVQTPFHMNASEEWNWKEPTTKDQSNRKQMVVLNAENRIQWHKNRFKPIPNIST